MYSKDEQADPEFDEFIETMSEVKEKEYVSGKFIINVVHAKDLIVKDVTGSSDPYVKINFSDG